MVSFVFVGTQAINNAQPLQIAVETPPVTAAWMIQSPPAE